MPSKANIVVGMVHIMKTGFVSERSERAAAAPRNFFAISMPVSLFLMLETTSPKS